MNVGMKLDHDYQQAEPYQKLFEGICDPLAAIRDLGMTFVEYPMRMDWEEDFCRRLVEENLARGLRTHFHPYVQQELNPACFEDADGNACRANLERILDFCEWTSKAQGSTCVLIFHGAANPLTRGLPIENESRAYYLEHTQMFFKWLDKAVADRGCDVLPVSEYQLPAVDDPFFRIGETFDEVMKTVEGTDIGLCWDTGHAFLGVERLGMPVYPPQEFIDKVQHVHLHDVVDGKDHRPIVYDGIPVEEHLRALKEAGFDRDINLELTAQAIMEAGGFRAVMARCIERIRKAWEAAPADISSERSAAS